jgi:hypothetical protein
VMATYTAGLDSSKVLDSADLHIGESTSTAAVGWAL